MPAQTYPFSQVDVFTSTPYLGNPVAVVNCLGDGGSLSAPTQSQMAQFANWTNLSETTFLLPPTSGSGADYKLKIFTPAGELPFAGHPTLGSCRAYVSALGRERAQARLQSSGGELIQECGIGNVSLRVAQDGADGEVGTVSFLAPGFSRYEPVDDDTLGRACQSMGLDPKRDVEDAMWLVNGPKWLGILLKDAKTVKEVTLRNKEVAADLFWGIVGPYPDGSNEEGEDVAFEVRTFPLADGIVEDPVTGSFNAGIAKWFQLTGRAPSRSYVNSQGTMMGRKGRVSIVTEDGEAGQEPKIWVGGQVAHCIEGSVTI